MGESCRSVVRSLIDFWNENDFLCGPQRIQRTFFDLQQTDTYGLHFQSGSPRCRTGLSGIHQYALLMLYAPIHDDICHWVVRVHDPVSAEQVHTGSVCLQLMFWLPTLRGPQGST